MDHIEQLPLSGGYDAILVIIGRFTKYGLFLPTHTTSTSRDLAILFLAWVFSKHGLPDEIISDRGSRFVSKFWKTVTSKLNIKRTLSTAYHPETDGQTERVNQTLEQYLRIYCAYQQNDWHEWLPLAEFSYNNSDHSSTGLSPFMANYGYHPSISVVEGIAPSIPGRHYMTDLDKIHNQLRVTLKASQDRYKHFADKSRSQAPDFAIGDLVLLNSKNIRTSRPTRKLAERYLGPFKIIQKIAASAFKLKLPAELSAIHPVFHVSLLELAQPSDIPGRASEPPGPVDLEEDVFSVKALVDSRNNKRKKRLEYRVEWEGYENTNQQYTWEPAENIMGDQDAIDDYHARFPGKPSPRDV